MSRRFMLVLSVRRPTADLIEKVVCDGAFGIREPIYAPEEIPEPTDLQREVAKEIELNMRVGSTRAQLVMHDRADWIDEFRRQIELLAHNEHPWQASEVHKNMVPALTRILRDIDKFRSRSVIEKVASAASSKRLGS